MNLEPETRKGYYISAEMKKVWAVEMELLKKLLEVCEKHHLRIFAEGGTLLGTVREHGYIPWDDDIDMAMLRPDYDKLQAIAKDEFKSPYFFQSGYTDKFPNGFTRIRMDGTAAILPQTIWHKCHHGIFIDLFPLDVIPDNMEERNLFIKEKLNKKEHIWEYYVPHFSFHNWKYNLKMFKISLEVWRKGFSSLFKEYDDFVKKYWGTNYYSVSLVSWEDNERYVRNINWYSKSIFLPFEDIMIPVPSDYDSVLKKQFGDYMKPVKELTQHGTFWVIDTEHSYKDLLPGLRRKRFLRDWKNRWNHYYKILKK